MELTENQIKELYKFTRQHFVEYYDVQSELVDHLANDIEKIWQEKPQMLFEQARDISFKKFGVFGFMEVVEQKQKQMTKKYWRILFQFVKGWFTIPKVVITSTVFLFFYTLLRIEVGPLILLILFIVVCVSAIIFELIISYKIRLKKKKKEKIYLLEQMIHQSKSGFAFVHLLNIMNALNLFSIDMLPLSIYWVLLLSFLLTLVTLLFYITQFTIPEKAEELLKETYPEYKLSQKM